MALATKKTLYILLILLGCLSCNTDLLAQPNIVKTTPLSLIFRKVNLSYERQLPTQQLLSVQANLRVNMPRDIPAILGFLIPDNSKFNMDNGKYNGMSFVPELRWYALPFGGKKDNKTANSSLSGLYIAPFLRYAYNNLTIPYNYTNSNNIVIDAKARGNLHSVGLGGSIGIQLISRKNIVFDLYGGIGGSTGSARVGIKDPALNNEDLENIKDELGLLARVAGVRLSGDEVSFRFPVPFFPVGRIGLALGFAF